MLHTFSFAEALEYAKENKCPIRPVEWDKWIKYNEKKQVFYCVPSGVHTVGKKAPQEPFRVTAEVMSCTTWEAAEAFVELQYVPPGTYFFLPGAEQMFCVKIKANEEKNMAINFKTYGLLVLPLTTKVAIIENPNAVLSQIFQILNGNDNKLMIPSESIDW